METISLLGIIVAIVAMAMFFAYLLLMAKLHGIQPSISDNYYVSRHRWTFVMVMWWIGLGMLPAMLEVTPEMWQFSAFFCCGGVIFVGAAAAFREEMTRQVHFGCWCIPLDCLCAASDGRSGISHLLWAVTLA